MAALLLLPLLASAVIAVPAGYKLPRVNYRPTEIRQLGRGGLVKSESDQRFVRAYQAPQQSFVNAPQQSFVNAYQPVQSLRSNNQHFGTAPHFIRSHHDSSEESVYYPPCGQGLSRRADGSCVAPIVSRNVYLYDAPQQKIFVAPPQEIPNPRLHYNYVFVRSPEPIQGPKPLVVPPTEQKTLVYVLSKQSEVNQEVIHIEDQPEEPEVYFVNYKDGENPVLPGGIDLQTALLQSQGGSSGGGSQGNSVFLATGGRGDDDGGYGRQDDGVGIFEGQGGIIGQTNGDDGQYSAPGGRGDQDGAYSVNSETIVFPDDSNSENVAEE